MLLVAAGVAMFAVGLLPVDRGDGHMPITEYVHDAAFMASWLATVAAMFVLTERFGRDPAWRSVRGVSRWLSLSAAAGLALFALTYDTEWRGLVLRGCIVVVLAWLILTAGWLRTRGSGKVAAASAQAERSRCRSQAAL